MFHLFSILYLALPLILASMPATIADLKIVKKNDLLLLGLTNQYCIGCHEF
jgi:hypothetical protein